VTEDYVMAKLMHGSILYETKQFTKLDTLADDLLTRILSLKDLPPQARDSLKKHAEALGTTAKLGRANAELAAGQYNEALNSVDKVLSKVEGQVKASRKSLEALVAKQKQLQDKGNLNEKEKEELEIIGQELEALGHAMTRDGHLYRGLLLTSIRASVLTTNKARAKTDLDKLTLATQADGISVRDYYGLLVKELKQQLDELRSRPGSKAQADKALESFAGFLDTLASAPDLSPAKITQVIAKYAHIDKDEAYVKEKQRELDGRLNQLFFIAHSFSSLDNGDGKLHAKAAELAGRVTEPKVAPPKKIDPHVEKTYQAAQLMYGKELRLGKKYDDALKVIYKISNHEWGKGFEVRKEEAFIWQDQNKFGAAAKTWNQVIQSFGAKPNFNNAKIKENYFEARYQYIYCLYMYAKNLSDPKLLPKKPEYIKRAANLILQLELVPPGPDGKPAPESDMGGENFKKRYQELLRKEDLLRKDYDALKKEKLKEKPPEKEKEKEKPKVATGAK
jgi:hypothetical protein